MLDFYTRIDELLKAKKSSQKELAEFLGLSSVQIYSNWKQRGSIPSADVSVKIASYLQTTVEYLVTGQSTTPKPDTSRILETLNTAIQQVKEL